MPITIYIVEDDESVGRSLERLLRSAGFLPTVFTSVDAFMARAPFDAHGCVIADVQMRGGSGLELTRRLKDGGSAIPVILLTAQDSDELRSEAKRSGFAAFFRKPVDDQALIDAIEWSLNQERE